MGKISNKDKMRIQTLREQGLGYKAIVAKYPEKQWNLYSVKDICKRVDAGRSVLNRQPGSGRRRTVLTEENIQCASDLIISQENNISTSSTLCQTVQQLNLSYISAHKIIR